MFRAKLKEAIIFKNFIEGIKEIFNGITFDISPKGISFKDSGEVVKNLTEIFEGGAKNIKNKLKELGYKLDAILYDESVNKC